MLLDPVSIGILSGVGIACGIAIYVMSKILPKESATLAKANSVAEHLPGMNCGACGKPGCFAYAQEVAKDANYIMDKPCMTLLQDEEAITEIEKVLGISLDTSGMSKMAIIHCQGDSPKLIDYEGIKTCKAAVQVAGGYKECPFGCLGLGDCAAVCPQDAISIDKEKNVAIVDPEKCIGCGLCVDECPQGLIELVPKKLPQYLACNYSPLKPIPGRDRCDTACIHCRKCVRACETDAVTWNKERNFPEFDLVNCTPAPESVAACPKNTLVEIGDKKSS